MPADYAAVLKTLGRAGDFKDGKMHTIFLGAKRE